MGGPGTLFGLQENVITMQRAGEAILYIDVNVPVVCSGGGDDCNIEFQLYDTSDNYTCEDSTLAIKSETTCGAIVTGGAKVVSIKLTTKNNNKYDLRDAFEITLSVKVSGSAGAYWAGTYSEKVYVIIRDDANYWKNRYCYATNDPRMNTFDGLYYSIVSQHLVDEFIMVRHKQLPVEIHLLTESCNNDRATCGCGVIVRAGRDVFAVAHCYGDHITAFLQYEDGILEAKRRSSNRYNIYLPHGAVVDVVYARSTYWSTMNIQIYPSPNDMNKVEGLCGNFNGQYADDLVGRDGTAYPVDRNRWYSDPDNFTASWGLNNTNLFNESYLNEDYLATMESWSTSESLCVCPLDQNNVRYPICSKKEDETCVGDALVKPGEPVDTGSRDQRSVRVSDRQEIRERLQALRQKRETKLGERRIMKRDNPDAATYEEAYTICEDGLTSDCGATQLSALPNGTNITAVIEDCALDVMLNKTLSWFDSSCSVIQGQVEVVVSKDVVFQEENPEVVENATKVCVGNCNNHGTCTGADTCVCDDNWGGSDCAVDLTLPPSTASVQGGGTCDRKDKVCTRLRITTDGCIPNVQCKIKHIQFKLNGTTIVGMDAGEKTVAGLCENGYDTYVTVIEKSRRRRREETDTTVADNYHIQLSNDGSNFGETNSLTVLDSTCLNYDSATSQITLNDGYCVIEGKCYTAGTISGDDKCKSCIVSKNKFGWEFDESIDGCKPVKPDDGLPTYAIVIIAIGAAILVLIIIVTICFCYKRAHAKERVSRRSMEADMYDNNRHYKARA